MTIPFSKPHHAKWLLPNLVTSSEYTCSECGRNILAVDAKTTSVLYDKYLCTWCEGDLLLEGYWSSERKIEHMKKHSQL